MKFHKKIFNQTVVFVFFLTFFSGCQRDRINNNNPFLGNFNFSFQVNLNLPLYSTLQFPGNSIRVDEFGAGNRGIIVFNTGAGFVAFDGACPNQPLSSCSTLTLTGPTAKCPCDNAVYSLFDGRAAGMQYPLKQYRTELVGNAIIVSN